MKKIIFLGIILGSIAMIIYFNSSHVYNINIDIFVDDKIERNELKIIINPNGYLLKGYEPYKDIGDTSAYFTLYKDSKLQDYEYTNINKYSDYNIYAKYKNKYAKMKYTNSLVLGDNETNIEIFIKKHNDIIYLVSGNSGFSIETIIQSSFKDIDQFKEDKHDMKMFSYVDKL